MHRGQRLAILGTGFIAGACLWAGEPTKLPSLEPLRTDADVKPVVATVQVVEPGMTGVDAFPKAMASAQAAMAKVRDYSAYLVREERINGKLLPTQTAELRLRSEPFSIYTKTIAPKNLLNQELAYVSGRKDERVRVKLPGVAGAAGFQSVAMTDAKANADSKYTLANTGMAAILKRVDVAMDAERKAKTKPEVLMADYKFDGKVCTRYEVLCEFPHKFRMAAKFVVYFEQETKLPIRFEMYDAAKRAETEGGLMECVSFMSLKLNGALGDGVFDK